MRGILRGVEVVYKRNKWRTVKFYPPKNTLHALRIHTHKIKKLFTGLGYNMNMKQVVADQTSWVQEHGSTLEGYLAYYKCETPEEIERCTAVWRADTSFLNILVRAGILEAAGHPTREAVGWILMHRQMWVQTMNRFGVPVSGEVPDAFLK